MTPTTGEMLDALAKIGRPTVTRMGSGFWWAYVELPTPDGVKLEVKSDANHPTHESALIQLISRLGTITDLGNSVSGILLTNRGYQA